MRHWNIFATGGINAERQKRWLKPKEVSEYLSVHPVTVYRMIYAHLITAVKVKGVGWRIDRKRLDKTLEKKMEENERRWNKIIDWEGDGNDIMVKDGYLILIVKGEFFYFKNWFS